MFITVGDTKIFAISFGSSSSPTILGIGGWIGSWELWAEPFSTLSASWHTITYDHRGTGATLAPVKSISFDRLVDDVFVVLDAFKVEQSILAAESAGATVALAAALKDPQRISGLVIVDGLYFQNTPESDDRFLTSLKSNYSQTLDGFIQTCVPETDSEHIKRWGRQILDRASPEAAIALYRTTGTIDLRDDISNIMQPTLIIHSEADRLVPLSSAQWLAKTLPNATLTVLDGASHVPTMTRSNDVAQAINIFFNS
jgi:pimeloyl-ACP methyl ester carboxylesterase